MATPPPLCCSPWRRSAPCAAGTTCCSTSTARPRSAAIRSRWTPGRSTAASAGLQKCLSGPPGSSPITFNDRIAAVVEGAQACRAGPQGAGHGEGKRPHHPLQLFRPRHADGLLVAEAAQPSHRGGLDAVRGARMRPRRAGGGAGERLRPPPPRQRRACGRASRPWDWGCSAIPRTAWPTSRGSSSPRPSAMARRCAARCWPTSASRSAPRSGRSRARSGASAPWATSAARPTCCAA